MAEPLTDDALAALRARMRACACPAHADAQVLLAEVDRLRADDPVVRAASHEAWYRQPDGRLTRGTVTTRQHASGAVTVHADEHAHVVG